MIALVKNRDFLYKKYKYDCNVEIGDSCYSIYFQPANPTKEETEELKSIIWDDYLEIANKRNLSGLLLCREIDNGDYKSDYKVIPLDEMIKSLEQEIKELKELSK